MTSLFEFGESVCAQPMPLDLLATGRRGVVLLEFLAVGEEKAEVSGAKCSTEDAGAERARQTRVMIDAARDDAAAAMRQVCGLELEERLRDERARVERVCDEFTRDRQRYFAAAESQVVRLALAMARRVLGREVKADVMHLQAVVRAALERVRDGSTTVLRVPQGDAASWSSLFEEADVQVVGDERLGEGECVLETEVGRVELGVQVQMEEIERGFEAMLCRQGG